MPFSMDAESLLRRHGGALRSLARELLHGSAAVDDVVQETWHRALRSPPRDGEGLGGWLATVLRHVTFRLRRGEARRRRHEASAAATMAKADEDVATTVARSEVAQRLLAAVDALDTPYRDVLWQRYFEGLPPRAIAAATGVPVATVKSRLQRGLAMLREALQDGPDGGTWRSAFAGAFGWGKQAWTAAGAAGIGIVGGVVMATWTKVTAVFTTAAIAAALWWPHAVEVPPNAPGPLTATSAGADAQRAAAGRQAVREPVGAASAPRQAGPILPAEATATIRGRCIDEHGEPLAGCIVQLTGSKASDERMDAWLRDHEPPQWSKPQAITTGRDGSFAIHFAPPPPFQFALRLHAPQRGVHAASWQQVAAGTVVDLGDVPMRAGGRLTGRVIDGEGRPVPETMLVVERFDQRALGPAQDGELRPGVGSTRSDATGAFAFAEPLLPGSYSVASKGAPQLQPLVVEIRAGEDQAVVVVVDVPEQVTIGGRVVDEDGQPVVDARVEGRPRPAGRFWSTATDGSFVMRMPRRDAAGPIDVIAECPGHEGPAVAKAVAWGSDQVLLTLPRGARLELRVMDTSGRPLEDFTVRLLERDRLRSSDSRLRARGPFAAGVATIAGVEKGRWLAIVEFPAGTGLATAHVPFVVDAPGIVPVHVAARSSCERRARVVDTAGQPVAGAELVVCEPLDGTLDETTLLVTAATHSVTSGLPKAMVVAKATTDASGYAALPGPAGQPLAVVLPGEVHVPMFVRDVRLDDPTTLLIEVPRGVRLVARLQPTRALTALRQLAGLTTERDFVARQRPLLVLQDAAGRFVPDLMAALRGDTRGRGRLGADGTFDLRGLRPDRYQMVLFYWRPNSGSEQVTLGSVDLTNGDDQEIALDLSALLPGTLTGSLVVNGAEAMLRKVRIEGAVTLDVETDGRGRFEVALPAGTYRVLASLAANEHGAWVPLAEAVTVDRDTVTTLPLSVQSGRVRIALLTADGAPAAGVRLIGRWGESGAVVRLPSPGLDGTLEVELPTGAITLSIDAVGRRGQAGTPREAADLGTVMVATGRTASIELRLPVAAPR